jgi:hypothetical protein
MTGAAAAGAARISEFGKYEGYSEATWDGAQRTSDYLTLPGGARLAYDLILPTRKGVPAGEPLPVLFKYTPYLRRFTIFDEQGKNKIGDLFEMKWWERALLQLRYWATDEGRYMDALFRTRWLDRMVKHGYAVIVVERSGTGASFGIANLSHEAGAREADEILDWIARQKWSNGRVGMYGDSFQAMVQLAAASTANPHLKATSSGLQIWKGRRDLSLRRSRQPIGHSRLPERRLVRHLYQGRDPAVQQSHGSQAPDGSPDRPQPGRRKRRRPGLRGGGAPLVRPLAQGRRQRHPERAAHPLLHDGQPEKAGLEVFRGLAAGQSRFDALVFRGRPLRNREFGQ